MSLSGDGLIATLSGWTDELFLECLTFEHATLTSPILLVNDRQDLVRTAGAFVAFPFTFQDFVKGDEQTVIANITADAVDQRIILALRGITGRPTVTYEVVRREAPNVIERGPMEFEVLGFQAAGGTISLRVSFALSFLGESFPADYFAPWNATA